MQTWEQHVFIVGNRNGGVLLKVLEEVVRCLDLQGLHFIVPGD